MKQTKLALVVVGALVFLVGLTSWAWAGGAGGILGCCVADRRGSGHVELEGTWTVVYSPYISAQEPAYIDVKLRAEKGKKIGFFELNLKEDVFGLDNFEIGCLILNPNEPKPTDDPSTIPRVQAFVNEILRTFFPHSGYDYTNRWLVLTRKSFTDTDGSAGGPILDTPRTAAIGDVEIYVVDPHKVKLESNTDCRP